MRQAERSELTRKAILEAARQLFADQGFGGATMDEVARAAGVAKGAVYHHFSTKEALFEAVFEQISAGLVTEVVRSGAGAKDALDAMVVGTRAGAGPARSWCSGLGQEGARNDTETQQQVLVSCHSFGACTKP